MKRKMPSKHRRAKRAAKKDAWGIVWHDSTDSLLYYDNSATTTWTATDFTFTTAGFSAGDIITISGTTPKAKKVNKKVHVARRRKTKKSSDGVYTIKGIQGSTITVAAGETITLNALYSFCKDEWI